MNGKIKKTALLLAAALGIGLAPMQGQDFASMRSARRATVPAPTTTVCGIMVSNDDWNTSSPAAGVYNIEVKEGGNITPVKLNSAMAEVVAALKKDNIMYTVEVTAAGRYYYRQMNYSDWTTIGSRQEIDVVNAPADLTYDPVTAKAYGSFWNENYNGFSFFGSFNLTTAEAKYIDKVQRDERDIFALAADGKGKIYCLFGAFDYLATLDPNDGQVYRIKTTGFEPVTNFAEGRVNSMCYDEENDRLIATVYEEQGWGPNLTHSSSLYTINPNTGAVQKIMDLPGSACFAGLHVVDAAPDPSAPGNPTNLSVNLGDDGISGTVSFTAPLTNNGGAPWSGTMMAIVAVNGNETVMEGINPGATVTTPVLSFLNGDNTVKITMADTERRGGFDSITFWAGEDSPGPVKDVLLEVENGTASLSWTAPAESEHGGPMNPANLKYRIVRQPENLVVAEAATGTTFQDNNLNPSVKTIYYTVAAYNSAGSAAPVESNRCLTMGSFTVPFTEGFDSADDYALWTIENSNGGATWKYNNGSSEQAAEYEYDPDKLPADDWLISPPIRLEADKSYKISYDWRVMMKAYPESFEVKLGTSPESSAMTTLLGSHLKVNNTGFQSADNAFTVPADGDYYVGIHCISDSYMYILRVDNISVVEIDNRVPATVSDLEIIPAADGVREATVRFTVPRLDNKGGQLQSVASATISRDGRLLATLTDVAPGKAVVYEDKSITADGKVQYSVVCANDVGPGVAAVKEAYIGADAPGAVGNLTIAEVGNHPQLSWTPPVEGVNGGWFDAAAVVYRIVRSDGTVLTEDWTATDYTDQSFTSPATGQDAVWYLVTPYVGSLKGAYAQSELLLCGTPYATPATETFANADMTFYPWIAQSPNAINYAWTLDNMGYNPQTSDQTGDRGLATFHSVGEPAGTESYFYSPKFDISGLPSPTLSFYLYHAPGEGGERMELLISDGGDTFRPLEGAPTINRTDATGWVRYAVNLNAYKGAPWVRIGFKGTGDGQADMYIDNVTIDSQIETDMAITALKAPVSIAQGEMIRCTAQVLNSGASAVESSSVKVTDTAGRELTTVSVPTLASGEDHTVAFEVEATSVGTFAINAELIAEGDGNTENNRASASVNVVEATVAAPSHLDGTIDNGEFTLRWEAPSANGVVLDDVESYQDWAIDGIGQWSMWDGDYDVTYMISNGVDYPNATERKAFQVCNADALGINIWDEGKPHSGKKMFMALCCYTYVNNDWLISPELNGKEQWISFYARSFTLQNVPAERMRVWYSTSDNDPANFTEVTTSYVELPGSWLEYRYYMPEGARHFAINCVSDGAFAMFVDDIRFNDLTVPTWNLDHYEIYKDGEKVAESDDTSYTGEWPGSGVYSVKAVYDRGESPMSEGLMLKSVGIGFDTTAGIRVEGIAGAIGINAPAGSDVDVMTLSGMVLRHETMGTETLRIPATPGVYLVRVADSSFKVIVR